MSLIFLCGYIRGQLNSATNCYMVTDIKILQY
jgi:hypothetical protein